MDYRRKLELILSWAILVLVAAFLSLGIARGQQGTFGGAVKFSDFTAQTAAFTGILDNAGQGNHILIVHFPASVATVTPIQVRLEAGFVTDTTVNPPTVTWFPITEDITSAPLQTGGEVFQVTKANGTFPAIRVNSVVGVPPGTSMNVHYIGAPFPVASISIIDGAIVITEGGGGGKITVTGVLCNGAACATGTNLTNEVILLSAGTWESCDAFAKTAPTGADLEIDVNLNGSTILTGPITIPAGSNRPAAIVTAFANTAIAVRDRVTFDIDQIGSGTAGQDVTVTCTGPIQ